LNDVDVLIPLTTRITSGVIARCPKLKMIMQFGSNISRIDIAAAQIAGVYVGRISSDECGISESVSEYAIYLALQLLRNASRQKKPDDSRSHCCKPIGKTLSGMKVIVFGNGPIGRGVSERLRPFGCDVKSITLSCPQNYEYLFESDLIFLCCPLNERSRKMVNIEFISALKPGVFIVNLSEVIFLLVSVLNVNIFTDRFVSY
jgi:D-3-phosphoglycerate dehydrogenase